ncbi:hypothetical protein O181_107133 [Austropuccinia psidii MF-1]|uniref:Uncharacterized protein n=1 Tax=Austropuccinia psidii MF-1 TaxID=1389203 RepID=A0A9Q3JRZ5_9BASI|nr:hypothetical protein [Austropuccinia psidii MF-1]
MDLNQDIQVINPKEKNVIPEERHKWRVAELPSKQLLSICCRDIPVTVQELVYDRKAEGVRTSSNPLDRENKGISSSEKALSTRKYRGPSKLWTPISFKGKVKEIKAWLKHQSMLSEAQKENSPVKAYEASTSTKNRKEN